MREVQVSLGKQRAGRCWFTSVSCFTVIFLGQYGLQTIETPEGSKRAHIFRRWVLIYWFSCKAQGKTRWQLLYLSPFRFWYFSQSPAVAWSNWWSGESLSEAEIPARLAWQGRLCRCCSRGGRWIVVLAEQLVSVDCWKCSWISTEIVISAVPPQSFYKKMHQKECRLCDGNCDLWFGVIKNPPHK